LQKVGDKNEQVVNMFCLHSVIPVVQVALQIQILSAINEHRNLYAKEQNTHLYVFPGVKFYILLHNASDISRGTG
jgi:hypothetical protein